MSAPSENNNNNDDHSNSNEETALQWLQSVETYKKRQLKNPIDFRFTKKQKRHRASTDNDESPESCITTTTTRTTTINNSSSLSFVVSSQNMMQMSADSFFSRLNELNELRTRSKRWRRKKRKMMMKRTGRQINYDMNDNDNGSGNANLSSNYSNKNPTTTNFGHETNLGVILEKLENELLESCFTKGTGLTFIDQILLSSSEQSKKVTIETNTTSTSTTTAATVVGNENSNTTIEIIGKSGTGKSQVLMSMAANYVACTSTSFLLNDSSNDEKNYNDKSTSLGAAAVAAAAAAPFVIILDPEHAVNIHQLKDYVVSAILRRWNSTDRFREYYRMASNACSTNTATSAPNRPDIDRNNNDRDHIMFEKEVLNGLDRIHIIRPKDLANGYVATLECLHQAIKRRQEAIHKETNAHVMKLPPILLLMDSVISAFDATDKMYEMIGTGLSGRNEFVRQLNRLRSSHDIVLVATRTVRGNHHQVSSAAAGSSSSVPSSTSSSSNCDGWNKMITSRITFERALSGSKEEKDGFGFVALMPLQRSKDGANVMEWNNVVPFSVTTDGIKC